MNIARSASDFLEKASNLIELCQQAKNLFQAGTADEKQQLLRFVASNLVLDRKKVLVDYKKHFDALIKAAESFDWLPMLYESRDTISSLNWGRLLEFPKLARV